MQFTIELGWWLIPAAITLMCFGLAAFASRDIGNDRYGTGAVISFGFYLAACVVSLAVWLIWSLVV